jgi:hypothetical protein
MRRNVTTSCLAVLFIVAASSAACSDDVGDATAPEGDASGDVSPGGRVDSGKDGQAAVDAHAIGTGSSDATVADSATSDADVADTSVVDASEIDASEIDASEIDASAIDASAVDASVQDSGAHEGGAADTGAPDAGVRDGGAIDAGPGDGGALDGAVLDAGTADAGHGDSGAPDSGAPDAGPTGGECVGNNNGAPCTPTEQRFVNKSLECYKCMVSSGCLDDALFNDTGHECGDVTGVAAHGAKTGTSRASLCLDTLDCILDPVNLCAADDVNLCYCGSLGPGNGCATATSGANGKCFQQEVDGLEHLASDAPSAVLPDYNALSLGAGMANQLFVCAKSNACDELCAK